MNRVNIGSDNSLSSIRRQAFGDMLLSKAMLGYSQLGPEEQTSVYLSLEYKYFHSRKCM